ncbi:MAG: enoyl-CoA hydratase-related protein [Acetobacteraceae bacterium]|nr:enoyl-CoA hydratase-related protein [Acetobacteraceae bacterium]
MLKQERDGATAVLTLDYPERRNALAMPMRAALIEAFEAFEGDLGVRAVVMTGGGGTFCAGGDISGMNSADLLAGRERFRTTHKLVRLLIKSRLPIVAAIEGFAVGAGLSLALCCDTVVAAADAKLAAGFGRVGLVADLGLLHTLPARVGQGRARQVLLYGEQMTGEAAERIGLVDHVVPKGEALATAMERARLFAAAAPLPVALTKQYLAAGLDAALDWEREVQSSLFMTADHVEGRTAFMEKRAPVFTGR